MKLISKAALLLIPAVVHAQLVPHVKYTVNDGLIADRITAIDQDDKGIMWFGTYYGMSRYNGKRFETIPLPSFQQQKYVSSISTGKNKVFAGFLFNGGVFEYHEGKVRAFPLDYKVHGDVYQTCVCSDSSLLVVAGFSCYRLKEKRFNVLFDFRGHMRSPSDVLNVTEYDKSTILVTTSTGILVFKKNGYGWYYSNSLLAGARINCSYLDPKQRFWVLIFHPDKNEIGFFTEGLSGYKPLYRAPFIYSSFKSRSSQSFWAIDPNRGLFNIEYDGKISHYPGVINTKVNTSVVYADRENNIWVANDPGVTKVVPRHSKTFLFDETAAAGGVIKPWNNDFMISNVHFVYQLSKGKLKKIRNNRKEFLRGMPVCINRNTVWTTDHSFLYSVKITKNDFKQISLLRSRPHSAIAAVSSTDGQTVWFTTQNHLVEYYRGKFRKIPWSSLGIGDLQVNAMEFDSSRKCLWIGDNSSGVYRLQVIKTTSLPTYRMIKKLTASEGLSDMFIRSMLIDRRGDLWVGTRFGSLYRISESEGGYSILNYNEKQGIECYRIMSMAEDSSSLFFAACDGVHRYLPLHDKWEHFSMADGLTSTEVFSISVDSKEKKFYAVTLEGVTEIYYGYEQSSTPAPLVLINSVQVAGITDSTCLLSKSRIKYPFSTNSLTFEFSASSYQNEKMNRYSYILDGYSKEWSKPTNNSNITYAALPPGRYTFKVLAVNSAGMWSTTPAEFAFEIVRPFYQSTMFIVLVFSFLGLLLYVAITYQFRHKIKLEKLRLRISRDLHDDLGSTLSSINILTKTAKRKVEQNSSNNELLQTFDAISSSAEVTLDSMDDIIWAINPSKDRYSDLVIRMKEFAIPLAESNNISLVMDVQAAGYHKLSMELRKNLFLIFKEAITNAVKHSRCGNIHVCADISSGEFLLTVADDGIGFDTSLTSGRNGVKNIYIRTKLVGGDALFVSNRGMGTKLIVKCPIR